MTWKTTGADPEALYNGTEFPSLDLKFADNKTLVDEISGQNLITFTRSSIGTYVDANGVIQTASTDTPRFDHDPVTGESLGLLVEESRTNLLIYSEEIEQWNQYQGSSVTPNTDTAPDGNTTADKVIFDGTSGGQITRDTSGLTIGVTYIASMYVKSSGNAVAFSLGVFGTGSTSYTTTNEWERVTHTFTAAATTRPIQILCNTSNEFLVWGAQIEAGSFPTSYIPTSGSTVTRAADVAEITGSNFSSWYNQNEGTVFVQSSGNSARIVGVNDGTDANRHELFYTASGSRIDVFQKAAGVNQVNITILSSSKSAFGYATNNYNISSGGAIGTPDTSANTPTVTQLSIGCWYNDTSQLNGHISRLTYYPYRLSDTRLQTITT